MKNYEFIKENFINWRTEELVRRSTFDKNLTEAECREYWRLAEARARQEWKYNIEDPSRLSKEEARSDYDNRMQFAKGEPSIFDAVSF